MNLHWHPFGGCVVYQGYTDLTYGHNDRDGVRYNWAFANGRCYFGVRVDGCPCD